MKLYFPHTIFKSGKHAGHTVGEWFQYYPYQVQKTILKTDWFCIDIGSFCSIQLTQIIPAMVRFSEAYLGKRKTLLGEPGTIPFALKVIETCAKSSPKIKSLFLPSEPFAFSEDSLEKNQIKIERLKELTALRQQNSSGWNDGEHCDKYNGYNDWSDEAIDEAFEGDPEATWNVD